MTEQEKKDLGRRMIDEGEWSEFHQKKARDPNGKFPSGYHWDMYDYHHANYVRMMKEYHSS